MGLEQMMLPRVKRRYAVRARNIAEAAGLTIGSLVFQMTEGRAMLKSRAALLDEIST
jgi:hypothetical protein